MSVAEIQELNNALIQKINQEALANPQSPYAGKWVGVANGKVVVVAETLSDAVREVRRVEPDPARTRLIEASRDYSVVEYVWKCKLSGFHRRRSGSMVLPDFAF
jgi:hypothetical protein